MKKTILTGETDWTEPDTNVEAIPNMVDAPQAQADSDGQKYMLAGTPLSADKDATNSDNGVTTLTPTNDPTKVQGILRFDINVANGPKQAAVVRVGTGNIANMDPSIQKIYTPDFVNKLKQSLPRLDLIKRY